MSWYLNGKPVKKVLVSRLRYMGDIVISTVLLDILKQGDSDLQIDYLCESGFAPILGKKSSISNLLLLQRNTFDTPDEKRLNVAEHLPANSYNSLQCIAEVRKNKYDLGIDLLFNSRSAILFMLSGCKQTIAGSKSWRKHVYTETTLLPDGSNKRFHEMAPGAIGENLSRLIPLQHGVNRKPFLDWFEENIHSPLLPVIDLDFSKPVEEETIVIIPGATWAAEEWSVENWLALISSLTANPNLNIKIISPPAGSGKYSALNSQDRCVVLPPLPLSEVLSILNSSCLVISVDGGLMHSAVALQKPTIGLLGPTNHEIWFPYQDAGPFVFVGNEDMNSISVADVIATVDALLGEQS
ncbi:MAG: glycosyltransferase family 9 protein [bacterium]|nr:glycosyltransferase family 9 protein [bacterium]